MVPILLTIGFQPMLIIPVTQAHLDGHAIITRTYDIYKQSGILINNELFGQEEKRAAPDKNNPDNMGCIVVGVPGKLFTYFPEGKTKLDSDALTELIENLSHYRDNPGYWPQA
ncbi:hypothetical protein DIU31_003355 [Mucilaginibacter rubeus]|uniref:Uncharacterized protein n=1 Tax=Mucilaginibacter rubeus TaxID=2027860 RepID=A0AAE6MGU3_9SPHI|nr:MULTISPECIES: hypothetical protein [Mucilaginibacter]QEM02599.1 hypothetical protein DIU31_003355 [Mucilaginibacter rubeus]QEM15220.1 hypothetical protein DIU38_003395 [Mucilaginibacter gossypii]QTE42056.1 hypothetical protein J3L19_24415 [Mucilaginibacter rubeus]QTE48657.1 hypothetical protein J3L21_24390 [Mucilaginibacter rubeus]QTE60043.1 hypothetical protein J3L23_16020 [Mucilaginibacter rubeus]